MTVKLRARSGAKLRHIKCVCGKPCNKRIGGPDPYERTKMMVSPVWISAAAKSSIISVYDGPVPQSDAPRRRILVVDDEQDIIDILQEHLATTYDVTSARDGRRALELVRATRPDPTLLGVPLEGLHC